LIELGRGGGFRCFFGLPLCLGGCDLCGGFALNAVELVAETATEGAAVGAAVAGFGVVGDGGEDA